MCVCVCVCMQSQTNATPTTQWHWKCCCCFFFPSCLSLLQQPNRSDELPVQKKSCLFAHSNKFYEAVVCLCCVLFFPLYFYFFQSTNFSVNIHSIVCKRVRSAQILSQMNEIYVFRLNFISIHLYIKCKKSTYFRLRFGFCSSIWLFECFISFLHFIFGLMAYITLCTV